jgi:DNA-binding transcriptional ArsR family regulator
MTVDALSRTFAALADPTRRAILARLADGETRVTELAAPFNMTLPAVTKHLKVLERAGLISRSRLAQARPCHIEPEPLRSATDWMAQYRHMWEARLDRLDAFLLQMQAAAAAPLPALPLAGPDTAQTAASSSTPINPPKPEQKP